MIYSAADIERLKRKVEDAELRVAAQGNLIERLRIGRLPTGEAEIVLQAMRDLLTTMRGLLAGAEKAIVGGYRSSEGIRSLERQDDRRTDQAQDA